MRYWNLSCRLLQSESVTVFMFVCRHTNILRLACTQQRSNSFDHIRGCRLRFLTITPVQNGCNVIVTGAFCPRVCHRAEVNNTARNQPKQAKWYIAVWTVLGVFSFVVRQFSQVRWAEPAIFLVIPLSGEFSKWKLIIMVFNCMV
jgi:hypothetical protein